MTIRTLSIVAYAVLFLTLLTAVMLIVLAHQFLLANSMRTDVPESECKNPIYTAHGDYALCLK